MAFPDGWEHKLAVTIDKDDIDADLTDWTLVFDQAFNSVLTSVDGPLDADGIRAMINGGGDLRASSDAAGSTRLAIDVRTAITDNTPADGTLEAALKVPSVSSSVDTTIYLWWGKSGETQPAVDAAYGQYAAYDSNYKGVWNNSGSSCTDRLGVNDLTNSNVTTGVAGKVGKAFSYNGSTSESTKASPTGLGLSTYTYEIIYKPTDTPDESVVQQVLDKEHAAAGSNYVFSHDHATAAFSKSTAHKDGTTWYPCQIPSTITGGNWYQVGGQYDGTDLKAIFNGTFDCTDTVAGPVTTSGNFALGSGNAASYFDGVIDEVRISTGARSAAWINADYHNQFNTSGFLTWGSIVDVINTNGIASTEAFGTAAIALAGQTITTDGISSEEAFGTAVVTTGAVTITCSGIASEEAFGTAIVGAGSVDITCSGIASEEAFGTTAVGVGSVDIACSGIASEEAFGTTVVSTDAVTITCSGIASEEAFGTTAISVGSVDIACSGIASEEAFGTTAVSLGAVNITTDGIPSEEAFGTTAIATGSVDIACSGIASEEAFGTTAVSLGAVNITTDGISSEEAFGAAVVTSGLTVATDGIVSAEAFGTAAIGVGSVTVSTNGIASAEAFGSTAITSSVSITCTGIASLEAFGTATVAVGTATITCSGITSEEAFGTAAIGTGAITIVCTGIASLETFGTTAISVGTATITCSGISSEEAFGTTVVTVSGAIVTTDGIVSTETFGTANVSIGVSFIYPTGIVSEEDFPVSVVDLLSLEFLMSTYVTPLEAQAYFNLGVLDFTAWEEATSLQKQRALVMATRAIDRLDFQGEKADEDQNLQFPRGDDTVIPTDIENATAELALAFLDGVDPELEVESLRMKSQGFSSARVTYDSNFVPEHIRSGIPSKVAWNYLKPYLRDIEQLSISRIN